MAHSQIFLLHPAHMFSKDPGLVRRNECHAHHLISSLRQWRKKGRRQAQVESTGHKNHRQNKRATVEKNSARCSGGGRSPATPRPWPTAVVPKGPQPRAFFSELLPAGVDNKHIAVMNSSCFRACGHLPVDLLANPWTASIFGRKAGCQLP